MEKAVQVALLLFLAGVVSYGLIGHGRECIKTGEIESKHSRYRKDRDPLMFWIITGSCFLAGVFIPIVLLLFALSILAG